jgi:DNA-directed RNA polymerase specialized sigma24 family protein
MLSRTLPLHDVADAEALASYVVSTSGLELSFHEREDLTAHLISTAWELSLRYEPGGLSFSTWCTTTLKLRTVDWLRSRHGRTTWKHSTHTHERQRPEIVSFETSPAELVDALTSGDGDPANDCDPDLGRLLDTRSSTRTRDLETLGLRPLARVGRRARGRGRASY